MSAIEQSMRNMFREEARELIKEIVEPVVEMFPDLPPIATVSELATVLRVSDDVLRQSAQSGGVPHMHLGRELRFNKATIIEWMVSGKRYRCEICNEKSARKPLEAEE